MLIICAAPGCGGGTEAPDTSPSLDELRGVFARAPDVASGVVVPLIGRCDAGSQLDPGGVVAGAAALPVGDLAMYDTPVTLASTASGFVRARAQAAFAASEDRNLLGYLVAGQPVLAQGPLKDAEGSMGVGYALAVRDVLGVQCRAYSEWR